MSDEEKTINQTDEQVNEEIINGNGDAAELTHYLLIVLNKEKYFIPLSLISKIINPLEIFPIPDTLDFIRGVSNFSGEIVPVVDLKKVLKLPDMGLDSGTKFVICHYQEMKVGFTIDWVVDSREIDNRKIKNDTTRVLENEFISGEYIYHNEVVGIVDIAGFIETHRVK